MPLSEDAELKPGQQVTVQLSALWATPGTVEAEIVRVFAGTIFPVSTVSIPTVTGIGIMEGITQSQHGLGTTLPGRNITVAEFRVFVNQRLGLASGALGLSAGDIDSGGIGEAIDGMVEALGDKLNELGSLKPYVYLGLGLIALLAVGYAAVGVARLVRG